MSEKVKVTKEQAEAIRIGIADYGSDVLIDDHSDIKLTGRLSILDEMPTSKLARAIFRGFEVETEFKVGDWIYSKQVEKLIKIKYEGQLDGCNKFPSYYRHATPEEIAEEKERRWWKKHDRDVWELKEKDLLLDNYLKVVEVTAINDSMTGISLNGHGHYGMSRIKDLYKIVCFAENRLDVSE